MCVEFLETADPFVYVHCNSQNSFTLSLVRFSISLYESFIRLVALKKSKAAPFNAFTILNLISW